MKYLDRLAKLKLWAGIYAVQNLKWEQQQHRKNREAEEAYVRKTVWGGSEATSQGSGDEEMGDVYLGDITNTYTDDNSAKKAGWPAAATLAALIPTAAAAGLAGYILKGDGDKPVAEQKDPKFNDRTVQIGLGKIEDYLKPEEPEK